MERLQVEKVNRLANHNQDIFVNCDQEAEGKKSEIFSYISKPLLLKTFIKTSAWTRSTSGIWEEESRTFVSPGKEWVLWPQGTRVLPWEDFWNRWTFCFKYINILFACILTETTHLKVLIQTILLNQILDQKYKNWKFWLLFKSFAGFLLLIKECLSQTRPPRESWSKNSLATQYISDWGPIVVEQIIAKVLTIWATCKVLPSELWQ